MTVSNLLSTNKNGWWIAVALFFTIACVGGVSFGIYESAAVTFLELVQTVCNGLGILGLWFLALRLKPFPRLFWRIFLAFDIAVLVLTMVFPARLDLPSPSVLLWIIGLLFYVLYYGGLFTYAFHSETIWQSTKVRRS